MYKCMKIDMAIKQPYSIYIQGCEVHVHGCAVIGTVYINSARVHARCWNKYCMANVIVSIQR